MMSLTSMKDVKDELADEWQGFKMYKESELRTMENRYLKLRFDLQELDSGRGRQRTSYATQGNTLLSPGKVRRQSAYKMDTLDMPLKS